MLSAGIKAARAFAGNTLPGRGRPEWGMKKMVKFVAGNGRITLNRAAPGVSGPGACLLDTKQNMNRRKFIIHTGLTSAATLLGSRTWARSLKKPAFPAIKVGICTDIHLDTVHDAPKRLQAFMEEMRREKPDFIIQLGDFCSPHEKNKAFRAIWNQFEGPRYDVIGNHDTDDGFTRNQVVDFWQMPGRYYSFDAKGYHFVVLDANEAEHHASRNPKAKYVSYIGDEQLAWLEADLENTRLPVIVFVHQGLDNSNGGVENGGKVRALLDRCNAKEKTQKVLMVFSGHHHHDYHNVINGIHYIQINSMSYQWMGKGYEQVPYSEEVNKAFPWTQYTAPYQDPLWAFLEISPSGLVTLAGRKSVFVGKTPLELGRPRYAGDGYPDVACISDRKIHLNESFRS